MDGVVVPATSMRSAAINSVLQDRPVTIFTARLIPIVRAAKVVVAASVKVAMTV